MNNQKIHVFKLENELFHEFFFQIIPFKVMRERLYHPANFISFSVTPCQKFLIRLPGIEILPDKLELAKTRFKAFTSSSYYLLADYRDFVEKFENCKPNGLFEEIATNDLIFKQSDCNDHGLKEVEINLGSLSEDLRRTSAFYGHPSPLFHHILKEDNKLH